MQQPNRRYSRDPGSTESAAARSRAEDRVTLGNWRRPAPFPAACLIVSCRWPSPGSASTTRSAPVISSACPTNSGTPSTSVPGSRRVASTLTRSTAAADGPPRTAVCGCVPGADDIRCARRHMILGRRGVGALPPAGPQGHVKGGTCECGTGRWPDLRRVPHRRAGRLRWDGPCLPGRAADSRPHRGS